MPANTNEWTTRIAAGDPEPTAEHTRDTLACHRYLSIGHAGGQAEGETRYRLFFLDFILLTQIQLLGRSGRGRKATRSRRRLCELHIQGVVTPIGPVLTSATAVKNFDRPNRALTV